MRYFILFTVLLTVLAGCERDEEKDIIGIVMDQGGCFPDAHFVQIVGGNNRDRSFICSDTPPTSLGMNCSNAVFIRLPAELRVKGKRIRFVHTGNLASCLSYSYAPRPITVKSLRPD